MQESLQQQIDALQTQLLELQGDKHEGLLSPLLDWIGLDPSSWWIAILTIALLAYIQNISFSIVSRSRNRNNMRYHVIASFFSNSIWFLTFRELVLADMTFVLFIPYVIATVAGSVTGAKVSMWIEQMLGASADAHLKEKHEKQEIAAPQVITEKAVKERRPVRLRKHGKRDK